MSQSLFSPVQVFGVNLPNRIVMAPMTRSRARPDGVPGPAAGLYYRQRSSAAFIVSEGINISEDAIGSPNTPGLYTSDQISAWCEVTNSVKRAGGLIVAQLWHSGRVAHSSIRGGILPVAPSAIPIQGQKHFTPSGPQDYETPRALSTDEVKRTIGDYRKAAEAARQAGFDAVELHSAFGYLPQQFLSTGSNQRSDQYGGSVMKRCRFVIEVLEAILDVWGADKVGIKLSPSTPYNDIRDPDPFSTYDYLLREINRLRLAYVHLMNPMFALDDKPNWPTNVLEAYAPLIGNSIVVANGGLSPVQADKIVRTGRAQLVSFGNLFIANPDLPSRLERGWPLATADRSTFYGGDEHGYTDYPRYIAT